MRSQTDFMEKIAHDTFNKVVEATVERFFHDRWGYGSQKEVEAALKEAVIEMIRTDQDIRKRMKRRLIDVIERGESHA